MLNLESSTSSYLKSSWCNSFLNQTTNAWIYNQVDSYNFIDYLKLDNFVSSLNSSLCLLLYHLQMSQLNVVVIAQPSPWIYVLIGTSLMVAPKRVHSTQNMCFVVYLLNTNPLIYFMIVYTKDTSDYQISIVDFLLLTHLLRADLESILAI